MKTENILLLDLQGVSIVADFFVICSAASERQLKAVIREVMDEVREKHHLRPYATTHEPSTGWSLLDYGTVVLHVFLPERRRYYNLEGFWHEATTVVNIQ